MSDHAGKMPEVKLANSYYAVAQHLQAEGERCLRIAKYLNEVADGLCEQSIRNHSAIADKPQFADGHGNNISHLVEP